MTTTTSGHIAWVGFDETTLGATGRGPRLDRLTITAEYSGAIEGRSTQALLVLYHDGERKGKGTGTWVGLEQVTGSVHGRRGSFVIRQEGTFDNTSRTENFHWDGTWQVVPGSGTDELAGLRGGGSLLLHHQPPHGEYTIDDHA